MIFIATKNGNRPNGVARVMLMGFMFIFAVGALHILLASLGVWQQLPAALTRTIDVVTGVVLLLELAGHLAILTWKTKLVA